MQIHEIIRLDEQSPTTLGGMVGSSIMGGLAKLMPGSSQDPTKMAAANQKKIDDVSKKALPMWMAKQAQIAQALGSPNMDEELEAWIEQNFLQGRLHVEDLDPAYQSKIKSQIKLVNSTTDMNQKRAEFSKLVAATMLARPSRQDVGRVSAKTNAQTVISTALALINGKTTLSAQQARDIGNGFKLQGINNIPGSTIKDLAGSDAPGVSTLLQSMGITVT